MKHEKPPVSFSEMGREVGWKEEGLIPDPRLLLHAVSFSKSLGLPGVDLCSGFYRKYHSQSRKKNLLRLLSLNENLCA